MDFLVTSNGLCNGGGLDRYLQDRTLSYSVSLTLGGAVRGALKSP